MLINRLPVYFYSQVEDTLPGLAPAGQVPGFGPFQFPATVGVFRGINQHQHITAIAQAYGLQLQHAQVNLRLAELERFLSEDP